MPDWDLQIYLMRLFEKGYEVRLTKDRKGIPHGYTIRLGKNCYRASKIDRKLTLRYIEQTWARLHQQRQSPPQPVQQKPAALATSRNVTPKRYTTPQKGYVPYRFSDVFIGREVFIPEDVIETFDKEFDPRFVANADQLKDYAIALFVMLLGGAEAAPVGSGGGGSDNDRDWGRKEDEDDRQWAIRCALLRRLPRAPPNHLRGSLPPKRIVQSQVLICVGTLPLRMLISCRGGVSFY